MAYLDKVFRMMFYLTENLNVKKDTMSFMPFPC